MLAYNGSLEDSNQYYYGDYMRPETEAALTMFNEMDEPQELGHAINEIFSGGGTEYWQQRRLAIAEILGNTSLSDEIKIQNLLIDEARAPIDWHEKQYRTRKRFAIDALTLDESIQPTQRFQYLAEIETNKNSAGSGMNHMENLQRILEKTPEYAPDGLILRLDFSDPALSRIGSREFVKATPHRVDISNLAVWKFDRIFPQDAAITAPNFTQDSGLHFKNHPSVYEWKHEKNRYDPSTAVGQTTPVYRLYSTEEDYTAWTKYGGYGWTSEHPVRGPAVFWGETEIKEYLERVFIWNYEWLRKLQADVGDFPGYDFIHDIEPDPKALRRKQSAETTD